MRRPSIFTDRREPLDVKMTPMIDVVFLLLIFFVWTASFHIVEHILPSSVSETAGGDSPSPNEPPPPEADFHDVVVRVLWAEGRVSWRVGDEMLSDLASVESKLARIYAANTEAPVIIDPDEATPLGDVIDVYDLSRRVGFDEVQFAAAEDA
ncbi:MAG TPA: biopolymer transporter ExbD [Pirellulaceae bacterium]|mgnify:CR=1 FL=1|nr:biopolymer transporter ExbD [Planctomycetales bacterium]MCB9939000.1 biopolymer transporter ExbD [Planctomycetaceae bacterium]HRX81203.1 biopolymer transporter ExbD [Pirellulaceae bacterium]